MGVRRGMYETAEARVHIILLRTVGDVATLHPPPLSLQLQANNIMIWQLRFRSALHGHAVHSFY